MAEGHRQRMRERVKAKGVDSLYPHEILEFLLMPLMPRKATNEPAHRLMNRFGSLYGVLSAGEENLLSVAGVTPMAAEYLSQFLEVLRVAEASYKKEQTVFANLGSVHRYLRAELKAVTTEKIFAMSMDSSRRLLSSVPMANGSAEKVIVSKRDIVNFALKSGAYYVVLCHNHPLASAMPSKEDLNATFQILDLLKEIGVILYDHIIITETDLFSFRLAGAIGAMGEEEKEMRTKSAEYFWEKHTARCR